LGTEIMANGQFHGKHRGTGLRIKNPLSLSVWVLIKDGQAFDITRTLKPGQEIYITLPHQGDYDVETKILRFDETGQSKVLGAGGWQSTPTAVAVKPKMTPQPGPVLIAEQKDVKSRRWVTVAEWVITKGFSGMLNAISIQLDGDCEAQVILPHSPKPTFNKPTKVKQDTTLSYPNNTWLNKGEAVRVKARAKIGNKGSAHVMIQGELYPVGTPVPAGRVSKRGDLRPGSAPEHITEKKPRKEPEETPLRSLGDMIEEMKKREEVKV